MKTLTRLAASLTLLLTLAPMVFAGYGHKGYGHGGSAKIALLLAVIAVGYWVLTLAEKQKGRLKITGRVLGIFILIFSLGGVLCGSVYKWCKYKKSGCSVSQCVYALDKAKDLKN